MCFSDLYIARSLYFRSLGRSAYLHSDWQGAERYEIERKGQISTIIMRFALLWCNVGCVVLVQKSPGF